MVVVFFSSCHFAFAGLVINEIMYDLSGSDSTGSKSREWIEVYNSGTSDVAIDASKWRIYDGGAKRTINGEVNFSIPTGSYVIFAGDKDTFLADHTGFSGTVYDTGITSLNNSGATLEILDQDGSALDTVIYISTQGGAGDGNSLQKISDSWSGATPTPGTANETVPPFGGGSAETSNGGGGTGISASVSAPADAKTKPVEVKKIKTEIISKTMAFARIPLLFEGTALGYNNESLRYGKYFWNFGDGDSKEIQAVNAEKFTHTYFYPGEYNVNLEYYASYYNDAPDASDNITVKVVEAGVVISSVGDEKDFFIELTNNSDYDADISKWMLFGNGKSFVFPRNTILSSKDKMIISPRVTHFSVADKSSLELANSQGEIMFDYSPIVPLTIVMGNTTSAGMSENIDKKINLTEETLSLALDTDEEISVEDLVANATSANATQNSSRSYIPVMASFVFIGASAGAVYFIRRRKTVSILGNDFKILNE